MIEYHNIYDRDIMDKSLFHQAFSRIIYNLYCKSRRLDDDLEKSKLLLRYLIHNGHGYFMGGNTCTKLYFACAATYSNSCDTVLQIPDIYDTLAFKERTEFSPSKSLREFFEVRATLGDYLTTIKLETTKDVGKGLGVITSTKNPTKILYEVYTLKYEEQMSRWEKIKNKHSRYVDDLSFDVHKIFDYIPKLEDILNDKEIDLFNKPIGDGLLTSIQSALYINILNNDIKSVAAYLNSNNEIKLIIK